MPFKENKADFLDFLENITDLIQIVSPEGRFLYVNRAWKEALGYGEEDLPHLSIFQVMDPDSHFPSQTLINKHCPETSSFEIETSLMTKSGNKIVAEGTVNYHCEKGRLISTRGIFRDITQRKQIEAELAASEAKFRHLVEGAKDLIWTSDLVGIFTYLSPQYKILFGWDAQEWIGQSVVPLIHPADLPAVRAFAQKMLTQGDPAEYIEFRHLHKAGHYIWIQCNETPISNSEGVVIGFQGIIRDISDRKRAEQQLAEKNIILHSVIDGTPDMISVKDLQGKYVVANAAFARFLNQKIKVIIGSDDSQLFSPQLAQRIQLSDQQIIMTGELATFEEDIQINEICKTFWTTKLPWRNTQGEIQGVIGIARDISDRKQAEAQLKKTNQLLAASNRELSRATRLKDQFLANMSHELRTPLNAILGLSECLQEGIFSPLNTQQIEAISTIQQSSHHLLALINDILDLAKIEAKKLELQRELVSVSSLCETSLLFVRELAYKKQIQLTLTIETAPTHLWVDQRRMKQVLLNLLTNAIKFTPEGGQVSLAVTRESEAVLAFSVIDSGIGIPPTDIDQIFQPFLQIDSRLNRQQRGTGLGLSLVKRIMELHGGTVVVTSEVGLGSCFRVELPLDSLNSPFETRKVSFSDSIYLPVGTIPSPPLILLVDDDAANIRSISSYLTAKGLQLKIAHNAQDAIAIARADCPHLILMDMQIPELDGIATLKQINRDRSLNPIPIITLADSDLSRDRHLAAGAKDSLVKPIKLRLLMSAIQQNIASQS